MYPWNFAECTQPFSLRILPMAIVRQRPRTPRQSMIKNPNAEKQ